MPRTELPAILPASGRLGAFVFSGRVIGAGACAKIYHATHEPSGRDVAVKVLDRRWIGGALPLEVRVHQAVTASGHPHLVRFLAHSRVRDPEGDVHCLVMEACHGGDVFSLLEAVGPLPEEHSLHIFAGAVSGVMHMHSLGVAHRDLKPENLLLDASGQCRICDFGLSHVARLTQVGGSGVLDSRARDACGTASYAPPEVFLAADSARNEPLVADILSPLPCILFSGLLLRYDPFVADVWSLAVTLFAMALGFMPVEVATIQPEHLRHPHPPLFKPRW